MAIATKQTLQKRIRELESKIKEQREVCSQYHLACVYFTYDLEITRKERNQAIRELILLQKSLLDDFGGEGE